MTPELQELIAAVRELRALWPESLADFDFQTTRRVAAALDAYDAANKPPLHEQVKALLPEGLTLGKTAVDGRRYILSPGKYAVASFYDGSPLTAEEIVGWALKLAERRGEEQ